MGLRDGHISSVTRLTYGLFRPFSISRRLTQIRTRRDRKKIQNICVWTLVPSCGDKTFSKLGFVFVRGSVFFPSSQSSMFVLFA